MAQMMFGNCPKRSTLRTPAEPFLLSYFQPQNRPCLDNLPRRRDTGKPTWGSGGVPTVDTQSARDNVVGLASVDTRALETVLTEQGPVRLPYGMDADLSYMPSSRTLNSIWNDSRLMGISDRYFR